MAIVGKLKVSPHVEKFQMSPHDRCGEIWNSPHMACVWCRKRRHICKIHAIFTRFHVEKNWAQKYICGEKMTNIGSGWVLMVAEYRLPMAWWSDLNISFISRFSFRQPRRPRHDLDDSVSERAKEVKLEPGTSFEERWMEFFWKRSTKVKGVNKLFISNGACVKHVGKIKGGGGR